MSALGARRGKEAFEAQFDDVAAAPEQEDLERALATITSCEPSLCRLFARSRDSRTTRELTHALDGLRARLPPQLRWEKAKRDRSPRAETPQPERRPSQTLDQLVATELQWPEEMRPRTPKTPKSQSGRSGRSGRAEHERPRTPPRASTPNLAPPRVSTPTARAPPRPSTPTLAPPRVSTPTARAPPRPSTPTLAPPRASTPTRPRTPPRASTPTLERPRASTPARPRTPPRASTPTLEREPATPRLAKPVAPREPRPGAQWEEPASPAGDAGPGPSDEEGPPRSVRTVQSCYQAFFGSGARALYALRAGQPQSAAEGVRFAALPPGAGEREKQPDAKGLASVAINKVLHAPVLAQLNEWQIGAATRDKANAATARPDAILLSETEEAAKCVDTLADGCRALTALQERQAASEVGTTEYLTKFPAYKTADVLRAQRHKAQAQKLGEFDDKEGLIHVNQAHRNYSRIPVGSIYEMDYWEMEASHKRIKEKQALVTAEEDRHEELKKRMEHVRLHGGQPEKFSSLLLSTHSDLRSSVGVSQVLKAQTGLPMAWRSEYRSRFLPGTQKSRAT